MFPTLTRSVIWSLPAQTLNILLSPGGDGNLLEQVDEILFPPIIHREFTFSSFALIFMHLFLSNLVRYVLGHAVATLLILESYRADGAILEQRGRDSKRHPVFRNASDAIRLIYRTQGVWILSRGLGIAAIYKLAHYTVRVFLEGTAFRHKLLRPFAYAVSSAFLCELHLFWTCTTISTFRLPLWSLDIHADKKKWRHLAVHAFVYGIIQALMYEVLSFMESADNFSKEQIDSAISMRASTEVLAVILMLALRVLALLPASITLTLAEASLLPETLETVIPSPTKRRGATIVELLGETRAPLSFSAYTDALKPLAMSQVLWLIELHFKKCLIQIILELLSLSLLCVALE